MFASNFVKATVRSHLLDAAIAAKLFVSIIFSSTFTLTNAQKFTRARLSA
jgi:predicted Co/Zn/Cd cation transporter (cation efflux family)